VYKPERVRLHLLSSVSMLETRYLTDSQTRERRLIWNADSAPIGCTEVRVGWGVSEARAAFVTSPATALGSGN
jgi:hypothetical protein